MMWIRLAFRNIFANFRRSSLVVLTIAISALALMLFAGYVNATEQGIRQSTIRGGVGHFQISGAGGFDEFGTTQLEYGLTKDQLEGLIQYTDGHPLVRRSVPRIYFSGLVSTGSSTLSFSAIGIDPLSENAAFGAQQVISEGKRLSSQSHDDEILLGAELAKRLNVGPGDFVTILTMTEAGVLNAFDAVISGIVSTGVPQSELYLMRTTLTAAQNLLVTEKVSNVAFLLEEGANEGSVISDIQANTSGTDVRNWRELSPLYDQVVGLYRSFFYVFSAFIFLITMFGIATIILTSVMERKSEIGVMRGLGISAGRIRLTFVVEGIMLAMIGLCLGGLASVLLSELINVSQLTAPPPPGRTVGYPVRIIVDARADISIAVLIITLAAMSAWTVSQKLSKRKVIDALSGT